MFQKLPFLLEQLHKNSGASISLRRKLFLYLLSLIVTCAAFLCLLISFTGVLSMEERKTGEIAALELSLFQQNLQNHYDLIAAQGISLSEELSSVISDYLLECSLSPEQLNNDIEALTSLQMLCYPVLSNYLRISDCSGVFYALNATVNTSVSEEGSYNGICLKLENISTTQAVRQKAALYRGSHETARANNFKLHSRWDLEFSSRDLPFFSLLEENCTKDLNKCYYWSETVPVENAWEESMILSVPILTKDGQFLGICGIEISNLYFVLSYASSDSALSEGFHLLSPLSDHTLFVNRGLNDFGIDASENDASPSLLFRESRYFNYYEASNRSYIGFHQIIDLCPLPNGNTQWVCAFLLPSQTHLSNVALSRLRAILPSVAFLILSLLLCILISKRYVDPILTGIKAVKFKSHRSQKTNITEIDDLLDFLTQKDEKESEAMQPPVIDPERFKHFKENLGSLTPAEKRVFDLYLQGLHAKEIAAALSLSTNTIKFHNANIYSKLAVSSRKELLLFISHMDKTS